MCRCLLSNSVWSFVCLNELNSRICVKILCWGNFLWKLMFFSAISLTNLDSLTSKYRCWMPLDKLGCPFTIHWPYSFSSSIYISIPSWKMKVSLLNIRMSFYGILFFFFPVKFLYIKSLFLNLWNFFLLLFHFWAQGITI
jgi:hypothetical protein